MQRHNNIKKILMISFFFPPRFSGAAKRATELAEHLYINGVGSDFLVPNYLNRQFFHVDHNRYGNVYRIKGGWLYPMGMLIFLLFNFRKYYLVHFHGFSKYHFLCIYICKLFRMPIIQKLTSGTEDQNELTRKGRLSVFRNIAYRMIDKYIAISSALKRGLIALGFPPSKVIHIPNGVSSIKFQPVAYGERIRSRKNYGLHPKDFIMLHVGTISKVKRIHYLLRVFRDFFDSIPEGQRDRIKFLLIGPIIEKDYYQTLTDFIQQCGLEQAVIFWGEAQEELVARLMAISDVMVFAGLVEGGPSVLIERKSIGIPAVAVKGPGVEDVVINEKDGFLVEDGNFDEFVFFLKKLYDDIFLRQKLGENAKKDCQERYEINHIVKRYLTEVYSPWLKID